MEEGRTAGILHLVYWLRNEGVPRLVWDLLRTDKDLNARVGSVASLARDTEDLTEAFRADGFEVDELEWVPHHYLDLRRAVLRLLRERRPEGVICYALGPHISVASACRSLEVPFLLHIGVAPPISFIARTKIRAQMLVGNIFVQKYVACSGYVRDKAVSTYRLPSQKTHAVVNGIRLTDFWALRDELRRPEPGVLRIGMVGSYEVKDQDILIEALAVLRGRGVAASLWLVGSGTREASLRELARKRGVVDWVRFEPVTDPRGALRQLDVFAYAVTSEEGLGIALVEALVAGLPIVASDVGACREVLQDGNLGLLVPERDPIRWADAILSSRRVPPAPIEALTRFDIERTLGAYRCILGLAS